MARIRTAKHPKTEEAAPAPATEEPKAAISKAEMVRVALAEGMEKPDDGVAFIKARYGIDLPKPMWSSYRAQQKARDKKAAGSTESPKRGRKPRQVAETGQVAPSKIQAKGNLDVIGALEALKPLVKQMGAEDVKRLVDILG